MIVILGAGLSALACSYHLGHDKCLLLEKNDHLGGHIASTLRNECIWDKGPHVSFTKSEYVKELFSESVDGDFDEYDVCVGNYYEGHWIDHPAQTSLYQVPEPLRSRCLQSFLDTRSTTAGTSSAKPRDYMAWLESAFGPVFANTFPAVYTRKYWTRDAKDLTTSWLGDRVYYPKVQDVIDGSRGPLPQNKHYISRVRYPRGGGFQSYSKKMAAGANIRLNINIASIDLANKSIYLVGGEVICYKTLVNTIPLPNFIALCDCAPSRVHEAAKALDCTKMVLVNVVAKHAAKRPENWMYVYDEEKLSTRITSTEKLTRGNVPDGHSGIQVEVYYSRTKPLSVSANKISSVVVQELAEMRIINATAPDDPLSPLAHVDVCNWANVIFDHSARDALDVIWKWLERFGMLREFGDLDPTTDWQASDIPLKPAGHLFMAGRFAQWKYFWSDDCVLRGRQLAGAILQAS